LQPSSWTYFCLYKFSAGLSASSNCNSRFFLFCAFLI
jgi:hypothetical protein